jgi:hypothetical protein
MEDSYLKARSGLVNFHDEKPDEITTLRKQVKILLEQQDRLISKVDKNAEQLALRDLKISELREALEQWQKLCLDTGRPSRELAIPSNALSTPFTPSDLNAYVEAEIAKRFEVVACRQGMQLGFKTAYSLYGVDNYLAHPKQYEPLYALRKD